MKRLAKILKEEGLTKKAGQYLVDEWFDIRRGVEAGNGQTYYKAHVIIRDESRALNVYLELWDKDQKGAPHFGEYDAVIYEDAESEADEHYRDLRETLLRGSIPRDFRYL